MNAEILLRTGEVARRLGVSRQHIVDLCDQGALPCVMVGSSHRRIPEGAVTAKLASVSGHVVSAGGSEQSLWLHTALIPRLLKDPEVVVGKARANLAQGRASGAIDVHSEPYAREWEAILDGGVGCTIAALLDPCEHAATLRSSSPFAGILPQDEVRAIKEAQRQRRLADLAAACPGDTILTGVTEAPAREAALQSDVVAGVAAGLAGVGLGAGEVVV